MHNDRFIASAVRPQTTGVSRAALLSLFAVALLFANGPAAATSLPAQESYKVAANEAALPEGLSDAVAQHVQGISLTVSTGADEPIMDLWFAAELPAPTSPDPHPGVGYSTLNEGVVLAVMRLHKRHYDFRDQDVAAGVYVVRYLRQPDDGNHLGETTFRDFAILTPANTASVAPQSFDDTLDEALELNLHPYAWGLWPANQVSVATEPGISSLQPDKWAIKLSIPRADGSSVSLAMVVVGNEWHY